MEIETTRIKAGREIEPWDLLLLLLRRLFYGDSGMRRDLFPPHNRGDLINASIIIANSHGFRV